MIFKKLLSTVLAAGMLLSVVPVMAEEATVATQQPVYRIEPEPSGTVYDTSVFEGHPTYLLEDDFYHSQGGNIPDTGKVKPSGWDIDYRGGSLTKAQHYDLGMGLWDFSETEQITMSKKLLPHKSGEITFEAGFVMMIQPKSGLNYELKGAGVTAAQFITENDSVVLVQPNGGKAVIGKYQVDKDFVIKATLNLDTQKIKVYSQNKLIGEYTFTNPCNEIDELFISSPKVGTLDAKLKFVSIYINYLVNDRFMASVADNTVPQPWTVDSLGQGNVYVEAVNSGNIDDRNSLRVDDPFTIDNSIIKQTFAPQTKKVSLETKFIVNPESDNFSIGFMSGKQRAIRITAKKNSFVTTGNKVVYDKYLDNLWYYLQIDADIEKKTADIYLNYRLVGDDIPFENNVSSIDTYVIETGLKEKATFWVDDIMVYQDLPLPADYVPEPKPVESEDAELAMMMYSMWREGNHYGWDRISPYEDREPYMGWYTEGSTEVADWEIKWLVEHGFDYQVYPWARDNGNQNFPIKNVQRYHAMDGFMKAEYNHMMKFAIMHSYMYNDTLGGIDDFKNNVVPYWIEYYFKNPSYMLIDNKPVVYYYTWSNLVTVFGGLDGVKEAFAYLDQACKDAGFAGVAIVGDSGGEWEAVGATHGFVYTSGHKASSYDQMSNVIDTRLDNANLAYIPSIPMGWSTEPWVIGEGGKFSTPETVGNLTKFSIDKMKQMEAEGKKPSKHLIYTCWNEWGEGHFFCPSTAHGFGYLQEIRNAATKAGYNPDEQIPTERAKARLQVLYPPERQALKMLNEVVKDPTPDDLYVLKGWYFDNPADFAEWTIEKDIEYIKNEDGKLIGKSNNFDPSIINENVSIPLDNVAGIRSNIWVDGGANGMFIYKTDLEPKYGSGKRFDTKLTGKGYTEYFAPPTNADKLRGATMTGLRFDPDDYLYTDFGDWGIKYIEIMAYKTTRVYYYLNGMLLNTICEPETKDGVVYMTAYRPLETFDCDVNYVAKNKEFTVKKGDKTLVMTSGNNVAKLNGADVTLPGTPYYTNGHFMVPMNYICDMFGITVTTEAPKEEVVEKIPFQYEFNKDGDTEGWTKSGVAFLKAMDGALYSKSVSTDPIVQFVGINVDANTYKNSVTVRLKNMTGATTFMMYFLTDSEPNWGGEKRIEVPITDTTEWQEIKIDVSANPSWKGKITTLRLDPTMLMGDFYIDYIRIE